MAKICSIYGDYMVMDPDNGLYEVWYVNSHDDTDDEYVSEWESFHDAEWNALCHHNADVALQQAQVRR